MIRPLSALKLGDRVSYTDMANPRRDGIIIEVFPTTWGTQYAVQWDEPYSDPGEPCIEYSDCRQHGWSRA